MKISELEKQAIKLAGIDGWYPWLFQSIDGGIICTGAVCPLITRGENKGQPNYRKADPKTKKTVFIPSKAFSHEPL